MDKLAAGDMDAYPFADILYGQDWQKQVSEYKKRKEQREFIFTGSIVCTSVGGTICACYLLICITQLVIRTLSRLRQLLANVFKKSKEHKDDILNKADEEKDEQHLPDDLSLRSVPERDRQDLQIPLTQLLGLDGTSRELVVDSAEKEADVQYSATSTIKNPSRTAFSRNNGANISSLLSDKESIKSEKSIGTAIEAQKISMIQLEDSLKNQFENLEKQVEQIRQMVSDASLQEAAKGQSVQGTAAVEQSGPINDTLTELTQQVAAIREYASGQQDRVKKLQEGYDLNIIKNFCLRIIRCIDNIESCISKQSEQDSETTHLKEMRDELLFALESSGVEQYEPEINSDYCGQERHAEAVKEKELCDDPNLAGKIAEVVKPGYQYFIDEENVKVVRPAMVKLFG
jgi:molecular chaperone GrpE (heat shock protein)